MYNTELKEIAKNFTALMRKNTVCQRCGKQPVEWHGEHHSLNENQRIAHLTALGYPVARIKEEMDRCTPLCRRCHMQEDGRISKLSANRPFKKGDFLPPKPCICCGCLAKPLRRGLCNKCNHKFRAGKL